MSRSAARIIICNALKLNLLKGNVTQIKLEAAGIVMRTPASCPCWFERASAASAGWACLLLIKQSGGLGGRQEETSLSRNKWKICLCFKSAFQATGAGSEPNYCFTVFFLFLVCVKTSSRAVIQSPRDSMLLQPHLTLSGMLEQQWRSCDHNVRTVL